MRGKTSYIAMRKPQNGSVTVGNRYGNSLDGASAFSISSMIRVQELSTEKSVLKIDGLVEIGLRNEQVYVKMPGYPVLYSNSSAGSVEKAVWTHIGMTTDGSRVSLYINGVLNCSGFGTATGVNTGSTVQIGTEFAGDMRYIYVFNECLDESAMKETMMNDISDRIPLAWYDFTQNPAVERISNQKITLNDAGIRTFTSAVSLLGNSFLEVREKDLNFFFPGYAGVQQYSVQMHFMFHSTGDDQTMYYNLLSDMGIENIGGVNIYLERMEDGFHLCYHHSFMDIDGNKLVSATVINQDVWTNMAIVFDIDAAYLYINGELDTTLEQIIPAFAKPIERRMLIGADRDDIEESQKDYFSGYISQCDVWNKALTADEVRKNIENDLDIEAEDLGFFLDIDGEGCFNGLTEQSIGMGNHAQAQEVLTATGINVSEPSYKGEAFHEPLSKEEREKIYEKCRADWINYIESHKTDNGDTVLRTNEMPYVVKAWKKDGVVYFVECYQNRVRTIDYLNETEISKELIWWVELILMIIGGVCATIFGLRLGTGSRMVNKLVNVISSNSKLLIALKGMLFGTFCAEMLFAIFGEIYKENLLKKILKIVLVSISFCSLLTIFFKIASWALGYGWAVVTLQLTALVVEIGIHIANYPKKEDDKPDIPPITLSEIKYTKVPIRNKDINSMESLALKKNNSMQSVDQGWKQNQNQSFSYVAYDMEKAETHAIRMHVKFIPIEDCPADIWIRASEESETTVFGTSDTVKLSISSKKDEMEAVVVFEEHEICKNGVCRMGVTLKWEYSIDEGKIWKKIRSTNITAYTLLAHPKYQWNGQRLWTDALDYMMYAVQGCKNEDTLYEKVTEAINRNAGLYYDTYEGKSYYTKTGISINLSNFLLDTAKNIYTIINCVDCASLVATFSNLFGGKLRCDIMENDPNSQLFQLNPIIPIGYNEYWSDIWFIFHEVAMLHDNHKETENLNQDNFTYRPDDPDNTKHKIYDACLKINYGNDPMDGDITKAVLPIKMSFSQFTDKQVKENLTSISVAEGDDSYREHLCTISENGIARCFVNLTNNERAYKKVL